MMSKFKVFDGVDYLSQPFTLHDLQSGKIQFTNDAKVLQYTGFKDHKGTEIYAKDIIRFTHPNPNAKNKRPVIHMVVSWNAKRGMWAMYWKNLKGELQWSSLGSQLDENHENVGNAYIHPDLVN